MLVTHYLNKTLHNKVVLGVNLTDVVEDFVD